MLQIKKNVIQSAHTTNEEKVGKASMRDKKEERRKCENRKERVRADNDLSLCEVKRGIPSFSAKFNSSSKSDIKKEGENK